MTLREWIHRQCGQNELLKEAVENCNDNAQSREILLAFIKNNHKDYELDIDIDKESFEYKLICFYMQGGQFKDLVPLWKNNGIGFEFDSSMIEIDYENVDLDAVNSQLFYQEVYGAGIFDLMLRDKTINEVGFTDNYFYVWSEKKIRIPYQKESSFMKTLIMRLSQNRDKQGISESNPYISFVRKDGTRISATQPPFTKQYNLSIRIFNKRGDSFDELHRTQITNKLINYLVAQKSKIVFQGELGVGKTTTMQSLYQLIPDNLHIATIEDSFEQNNGLLYPNKRILEFQTLKNMDYFDAIQMILRSSVDFANIGEVRSPDSAKAVIDLGMAVSEAMYFTLHATSPINTVPRMVNLLMMTGFYKNEVSAALDVISSIDYIIQHGWIDGRRDILSITEVNVLEQEKMTVDALDDKEKLERMYLINQIQSNYRNKYELRTIYETGKGIINKPRKAGDLENETIFKELFQV